MKIILLYIILPALALVVSGFAINLGWSYSPTLVLFLLGVLILIGFATVISIKRRDRQRGWRVGHQGRDQMFYEEMIGGKWERIDIDGGMLCGAPHHVIYFPKREEWDAMPDWARGRQLEITNRIKQEFKPPGYEYEE